jgi:hypothetical protein
MSESRTDHCSARIEIHVVHPVGDMFASKTEALIYSREL